MIRREITKLALAHQPRRAIRDAAGDWLRQLRSVLEKIKYVREKYGHKITFWGGISTQRTLPYGTPAEVAREVADKIQIMARSGGYITSPSQEIQTDVPYENLIALIESAKRFA